LAHLSNTLLSASFQNKNLAMDKEVKWNRLGEVKCFVDELGELVAFPVQRDHKFLGGEYV
jgi:hypothetical protein